MELNSRDEEFNGSSGVGVTKFIPMYKSGADGKKSNAQGFSALPRGVTIQVTEKKPDTSSVTKIPLDANGNPVTPITPPIDVIPPTTAGKIFGMSYLTAGIVGVLILGLGVAGIVIVPKL